MKDYYKSQYNIKIKDLDQPILIAETKERARKKNNKENKNNNNADKQQNNHEQDQENVIQLIPELFHVIGPTMPNDGKDKRKGGQSKSRSDPIKKWQKLIKFVN